MHEDLKDPSRYATSTRMPTAQDFADMQETYGSPRTPSPATAPIRCRFAGCRHREEFPAPADASPLVVISAVSPPNDARSCLTLHQPTPDKHTPPIATHVDGGHGHHLARTTQRKTKAATGPSSAMTTAAITTAPTRVYGSGPGACGGGDVGVGDPFRRRPLAAVVRGPPCQDDIYMRRYRDWSMANRPNAANPSATAVSRNLPNGCARMVCMAPSSPCAFCGSKVSVA